MKEENMELLIIDYLQRIKNFIDEEDNAYRNTHMAICKELRNGAMNEFKYCSDMAMELTGKVVSIKDNAVYLE